MESVVRVSECLRQREFQHHQLQLHQLYLLLQFEFSQEGGGYARDKSLEVKFEEQRAATAAGGWPATSAAGQRPPGSVRLGLGSVVAAFAEVRVD